MRFPISVSSLVFLAIAVLAAKSAHAGSALHADRVTTVLDRVDDLRRQVEQTASTGRKLSLLDREVRGLRRAYGLLRAQRATDPDTARTRIVERRIIKALNAKTRIYMERGSLVQARKTNRAALTYGQADVESLKLRYVLDRAGRAQLTDQVDGITAIQRLRERRADSGAPLRERGLTRRR